MAVLVLPLAMLTRRDANMITGGGTWHEARVSHSWVELDKKLDNYRRAAFNMIVMINLLYSFMAMHV
jgi:hypothetical protein